jgi:antitoxin component of RelBE/YafQ-DinJ toxin-antitoxin module
MVSVRLDAELVKDLRRIAEEQGVTMSELLREGATLVVTYAGAKPYWVSVRSVKSLVETMAEVTKSPTSSTSAIRQPA